MSLRVALKAAHEVVCICRDALVISDVAVDTVKTKSKTSSLKHVLIKRCLATDLEEVHDAWWAIPLVFVLLVMKVSELGSELIVCREAAESV